MDVPEVDLRSALDTTPWAPSCHMRKEAVYFDSPPSYEEFFHAVFVRNQLCIIGSSATASWLSRKHWVSENGSPNLKFLLENFGNATAPVADCGAEEYQSHPKSGMVVADFLSYWRDRQRQGHPTSGKCLYLKDWHFTRDFPSWVAYTCPSILCSDWLNEFWDVWDSEDKGDDYRFVYMGPKHSWTPFHCDVLRSYSWSANICGRKKWTFYRPGDEEKLKDQCDQLPFDLKDPALGDPSKFPQAAEVKEDSITLVQNPGEIIFVPSGWHHQVVNEEDTISINHNWVNGCNAHLSWAFLKSRLGLVENEISDCRGMDGWEAQCQLILKADSGMDYLGFFHFVSTIARHRLQCLDIYFSQETFLGRQRQQQQQQQRNNDDERLSLSPLSRTAMPGSPHVSSASAKPSRVKFTTTAATSCTDNEQKNMWSGNSWGIGSPAASSSSSSSSSSSQHGASSFYSHRASLCLWHMNLFYQNANSPLSSRSHETCPHWAHCGPNLALFDLRQAAAILKDVEAQPQFKVVSEESGGREMDDSASLREEIDAMLQRAKNLL